MRILFLIKADSIGGAEKQLSDIVNHFQNKFEKIVVAAYPGKLRDLIDSASISYFELYNGISPEAILKNYKTINEILISEKIELVQYFHRIFLPIIWLIKIKFSNLKIVYTATSVFKDIWNYFITADYYLAVSDAVRQNLIKYHSLNTQKITVIKHGIRLENYDFHPLSHHSRGYDSLTLGYAGRLEESKGVKYLLYLIEKLKEFPISLIIQGEGSQTGYLKQLVIKLGIQDKVNFCNWDKNVKEFFNKIDVFVLPSIRHEGLGLVLIEALASGKIVIGTRVGGVKDIIENKVNGFLVQPKNVNELRECILDIFNDNFDKKGLTNNILSSLKYYSLEDKISEYQSFYSKIGNDIT